MKNAADKREGDRKGVNHKILCLCGKQGGFTSFLASCLSAVVARTGKSTRLRQCGTVQPIQPANGVPFAVLKRVPFGVSTMVKPATPDWPGARTDGSDD